jgi:hypothetical protein
MKTKILALIGAAIMPLLAGCATKPVTLSPVGPEPSHQTPYNSTGHLRVYSDTETCDIGENNYYPHMGYVIRGESGKVIKFVPNHIGDMDESPTLVTMPTGNYQVVAESSAYGRVTVPVIIQAGKTTVLHLDRGWRPALNSSSNEVVRLPDGEAVGWSGSIAKSSE